MTFETVSYETNGPVARVTLNRPEVYNAFDKTLRAELSAVFDLVEAAEGIRVCILKGAGKGFSAGGDITDFGYDPISDLIVGEFLPLFEKVDKGNVIYIAQIHGSCAGIAAALAMTCDFITMAEDSALYMAFAAIALAPDGGNTFHLMNAMGYRRALEAIIEGRHIPAPECKALGIANRVHPAPELETETMAWATRIAATAPLATAATKRVLRSMVGRTWSETVRAEAEEQNALIKSKDFKRGIAAFREKSSPTFLGD